MAGSTYTWIGGSGSADLPSNWSPTGGPNDGDTVIIPNGTVVTDFDPNLVGNIVEIGGTGGVTAAAIFPGDSLTNFGTPTLDAATVIDLLVPGHTTAESVLLGASGTFVNQGSILADGPAGSSTTIAVQQTFEMSGSSTVTLPGYFINYGLINVSPGNTLTISIGANSELFNAGAIIDNGGSLLITSAASAIVGGVATAVGPILVGDGGTIEDNAALPSTANGSFQTFGFTDGAHDTLKLDQAGQFTARIIGFEAGDTIDVGKLTANNTVFNQTSGLLYLENGSTIVASLDFATGVFTSPSFVLGTAPNGDTTVTTAGTNDVWLVPAGTNSFTDPTKWSSSVVPGASDTAAFFNNGDTTASTITTGSTALTVGSLLLADPYSTLRITNALTISAPLQNVAGTVEVTGTASAVAQQYRQTTANTDLLLDPGATLDLLGRPNDTTDNNGTISPTNGPGALSIVGSATINGATINAGPTQSVGGATGGSFLIGQAGGGTPVTVLVENGATVSDTYSQVYSDPTSFGSLTLTGANTTWTDAGDPTDPYTRGYMLVGTDSQSGNTPVPPYAGQANLSVIQGATLVETSYAIIGQSGDSSGSVSVNTGGQWDIGNVAGEPGYLVVGQSGSGTLTVAGPATVSIGGGGTIIGSSGTSVVNYSLDIGQNAGTHGTVTVDNPGALLTGTNTFRIGDSGVGDLFIESGASAHSGGSLLIGNNAGGSGDVAVSGGTLSVALSANVGGAGTGTLAVSSGGTFTAGGVLTVSGLAGGASVTGKGSEIIANGGIVVGNSASALFTVQNTAVVDTSDLSLGGSTTAPLGGNGTLALTGTGDLQATTAVQVWSGSTLSADATSAIDVGTSGSFTGGTMLIESGRTLLGNGLISAGVVVNDGTIDSSTVNAPTIFSQPTLTFSGALNGTGTVDLAANSTMRVNGTVGAGQTFNFGPGGVAARLILNSPGSGFSDAITGLWSGSKIEFGNGMTITSASLVNGNTIAVNFNGSGGSPGVYDLTNVSFGPGSGQTFFVGTDGATGLGYIQVAQPFINWSGTVSTDFGTGGNWFGGIAPNGNDTANFGSGGGTVTGTGSVLSLDFGNNNTSYPGTWILNGTSILAAGEPDPPYTPFAAGFSMNTVFDGGTLSAAGGATSISNDFGVTVTAENAANVTTAGDNVGGGNGQYGALVVTGSGTDWTEDSGAPVNGILPGYLYVAVAGAVSGQPGSGGALTVTAGALLTTQGNAVIATNAGDDGSATVSAGGRWVINGSGGINLGSAGAGTLAVNNGTVNSAGFIGLGAGTGGQGTVTVTAGGTLTGGAGMNVGGSGTGALTVNGATATITGYTGIGQNTGGVGTVSVSGGGVFSSSTGFDVGASGSGTLTVNGGIVTGGGFVGIGQNTGGIGTASVTGGGDFNINGLDVGGSGDGMLTVNTGEITDSGNLAIGANSGGVGIFNATSATVSVASGLNIGLSGDGLLTLNNGATFQSNGPGFAALGNLAGGAGTLVVNSGGSFVNAGTQTDVGDNAGSSGTMIINAGGTFTSTLAPETNNALLSIGANGASTSQPAATGSVLVTGAGALLNTNDNALAVGNSGVGSLIVTQGGSVVVGSENTSLIYALGIANGAGTGAVTVNGAGSTLTADGYLLDGRGGTGSLLIENGAGLIVNDSTLNGSGIGIGAGRSAGPSGPANVGGDGVALVTSGGVLDLNSTTSGISVGGDGVSGALTVNNGGTVLAGTGLTVGTATTASGTIYGGNGQLDIGAGGVVTVNNPTLTGYDVTVGSANSSIGGPTAAASGQVLVSGAGALLNANGAGVAVGLLSSGNLTISQGGSAVSSSPNNNLFVALSIGRDANGSVTITDKGSSFTANGGAYVGRAGVGNLTIENDGSLYVGVDGTGAGGFEIGGAGVSTSGNVYAGGSGSALVTTGGDLFSAQSVAVGEDGADGTLTIQNGGTVEAGTMLFLGNSATLTAGETIITTSGTTILSSATTVTGDGLINVGAGGLLKIDGTGVASGTPSIVLGAGTGASGALNVSGAGATVNNAGGFQVGSAGFGSLAIQSGGTVITSPGTTAGLVGADIASGTGSDGSNVSVTGNGSDWQITGSLLVGDAAAGSLAITAGGTVAADSGDIGVQTGASGNISVIGTGSALTYGGQLSIGDNASAELSILSGGTVNANNADIGLNANGTGNVDIEGAGSRLDIANNLNIGDGGVGVLTLGNNTELTVGNNINVGTNGILNQLGGSIDPSTITIAPSGRQGGHGSTTASVEISNAGTLYASSGTETVNTPLITAPSGKTGILEIDTNGDLVLNVTSVDATQSVNFTDSTGILTLGTIGGFGGTIATVNPGDQIIVQGTSIASDSFNTSNDVLTLFNGSGGTIGTLQLAASVDGSALLPNGSGGIGGAPPCFMAGTRISTERGEVAVEDLREGDRVQVVLGTKAQPIIWIGHRTVDCSRHPKPHQVWPVRIAAGAFGPGRPYRDLYLSPDHAVHVGDVLIPAKHLINGTTITQIKQDSVTYYHVELPGHSVLLAEGLSVESYLDTGDRSNFVSGDGPIALYPDFASRVWEAEGCAPLVVTGNELAAVRRWVNGLATQATAQAMPIAANR
jgi:T5SS/PEP-CTERM-associated repeat protein